MTKKINAELIGSGAHIFQQSDPLFLWTALQNPLGADTKRMRYLAE
jgi:hypothetical protein